MMIVSTDLLKSYTSVLSTRYSLESETYGVVRHTVWLGKVGNHILLSVVA